MKYLILLIGAVFFASCENRTFDKHLYSEGEYICLDRFCNDKILTFKNVLIIEYNGEVKVINTDGELTDADLDLYIDQIKKLKIK